MDFLGPLGLTLALAWLLDQLLVRLPLYLSQLRRNEIERGHGVGGETRPWRQSGLYVIYWVVLAGAVLPDLLDKSLGFWLAPDLVNNSLRNVGHSMTGTVAFVALAAAAPAGSRLSIALSLGLALTAHLLLDHMWTQPEVLFWPVTGWGFPQGDVPWSHWTREHFMRPPRAIADIIGIVFLALWTAYAAWKHRATGLLREAASLRQK